MLVLCTLIVAAFAKTHFTEEFNEGWEDRWVQSMWKDEMSGKFVASPGMWNVDPKVDTGIKTKTDHRFYAISTQFPTFSNKGKDLVVQFTVKHEQFLDCGGGYIKLLKSGFDVNGFGGETPFYIMFGPDICGGEKRTHFLVPYGDENFISKRKFRVESDDFTHQYTAIIHPDSTYEVLIDNIEIASGLIEEAWDILPPKEIKDPDAAKPADWVDVEFISDPEDTKPAGYDDIPEFIPDDREVKPGDWDDEEDGEWQPPLIENPEYKGEWKPKQIKNPDYQGRWEHPIIKNPEYKDNVDLYLMENIGGVGIEIWQVSAGSIFDNIYVGDSIEEAKDFSERTFQARKEGEKSVKEAYDDEKLRQKEDLKERVADETDDDFETKEDL